MNNEVLLFAQKLTGAWATPNKEMFWLFDTPDPSTYPTWFYLAKHTRFDNFIKFDMFLHNPVSDVFRLETNQALGHATYVLKFLDENTLEVGTLISGEEVIMIFNREENVKPLFEVGK